MHIAGACSLSEDACSYSLNASVACIVWWRTSVVTKLSVLTQYITGSWQIQWSICYHTHQVHWLRGKRLQIGAQCVREVARFQDAYHSFQKVLSGLLTSLTCSFLKWPYTLWYHYLFVDIFRKTGQVTKDLFFRDSVFLRLAFSSPCPCLAPFPGVGDSWSDCCRKWAVENWNCAIWRVLFLR